MILCSAACADIHFTARSKEKNIPFSAEWQMSQDTTLSYRQVLPQHRQNSNVVGILHISSHKEDGTNNDRFLEVAKLPSGYAAQARLFETEQSQTNVLVGHDSEAGLSAGIRWSWQF